jgi:hypothetical protein
MQLLAQTASSTQMFCVGGRDWQSNRDNYVMWRFVICALTGDHSEDDEIGCVHSARVTTTERYHVKYIKLFGIDNIKMKLNERVRVWTEVSLLKWDQLRRVLAITECNKPHRRLSCT